MLGGCAIHTMFWFDLTHDRRVLQLPVRACVGVCVLQWGWEPQRLLVGPTLSDLSVDISAQRCGELCCVQSPRPWNTGHCQWRQHHQSVAVASKTQTTACHTTHLAAVIAPEMLVTVSDSPSTPRLAVHKLQLTAQSQEIDTAVVLRLHALVIYSLLCLISSIPYPVAVALAVPFP